MPLPLPRMPVVLVLQNDAETRHMLALWFQHCGCRVIEAANTLEALLCVFSESRPDAIITDMSLDGAINGLDFCRIVRTDPASRRIPMIAATGWASPRDMALSLQAAFDHVFDAPDPVSDEELRAIGANTRPN